MAGTCQNCGGKYNVDITVHDQMWNYIRGTHTALCGFCIATGLESQTKHSNLSLIDTEELKRLKGAEGLIYVPGSWVCDKCTFVQIRSTFSVGDGIVRADNSSWLDPCPNCDIPMRRQTEREAGNQMCERLEALVYRLRDAELEIQRLKEGKSSAA